MGEVRDYMQDPRLLKKGLNAKWLYVAVSVLRINLTMEGCELLIELLRALEVKGGKLTVDEIIEVEGHCRDRLSKKNKLKS